MSHELVKTAKSSELEAHGGASHVAFHGIEQVPTKVVSGGGFPALEISRFCFEGKECAFVIDERARGDVFLD